MCSVSASGPCFARAFSTAAYAFAAGARAMVVAHSVDEIETLRRRHRPSITVGAQPGGLPVAGLDHGKNYKSLLQQVAQRTLGATPVYKLLDEKGPDHSKCFKITALIGPNSYPAAWGANKKAAEQRAAHNALHSLEGKPIPYESE